LAATFEIEPAEEHPQLPLTVALGALAILAASLVVGKIVVEAIADRGWPLVSLIVVSAFISYGPSVAWLFYVRRRWGSGRFGAVGWRFRWIDLGWGPVAWLSAIGVEIALALVVLTLDVPLTSNVDAISDFEADRAYLIATAVAAVIAAPVVEELVFRGLVMRGFLSKMGPVLAIGLQGILFGAAHFDPVRGTGNAGLVIVLSGVGVVLGGAAYLTRRLGPSVIAHAIFNGIVVLILVTGVLDDIDTEVGVSPGSTELEVVDQADIAEPCRGEEHGRTVDPLDRLQCVRVDEFDVLE
jgi:hypothetical protein